MRNKAAAGSCPPPLGHLSKKGPCFEKIKPPEASAHRRQGYILVIKEPSVTRSVCSWTTGALEHQKQHSWNTITLFLGIREPCILAMHDLLNRKHNEFSKSPNPGIANLVGLKQVLAIYLRIPEKTKVLNMPSVQGESCRDHPGTWGGTFPTKHGTMDGGPVSKKSWSWILAGFGIGVGTCRICEDFGGVNQGFPLWGVFRVHIRARIGQAMKPNSEIDRNLCFWERQKFHPARVSVYNSLSRPIIYNLYIYII